VTTITARRLPWAPGRTGEVTIVSDLSDEARRTHQSSGHAVYEQLHKTEEFATLRRRFRAFAIPWTIAFLAWYLLYVVMCNWATDFMDTRLFGNVNVALVFGLLQFLSTFVIAFLYSRHANRYLDPLARTLEQRYNEEVGR
jgi:uncharacterized membrane protein (DUF485 family)